MLKKLQIPTHAKILQVAVEGHVHYFETYESGISFKMASTAFGEISGLIGEKLHEYGLFYLAITFTDHTHGKIIDEHTKLTYHLKLI